MVHTKEIRQFSITNFSLVIKDGAYIIVPWNHQFNPECHSIIFRNVKSAEIVLRCNPPKLTIIAQN